MWRVRGSGGVEAVRVAREGRRQGIQGAQTVEPSRKSGAWKWRRPGIWGGQAVAASRKAGRPGFGGAEVVRPLRNWRHRRHSLTHSPSPAGPLPGRSHFLGGLLPWGGGAGHSGECARNSRPVAGRRARAHLGNGSYHKLTVPRWAPGQ